MVLIVNIIVNILEVWGFFCLLCGFRNIKPEYNFKNISYILLWGILNGIIVNFIDLNKYKFVVYISLLFYIWAVSKEKLYDVLLLFILMFLCMYIIQIFTSMITYIIPLGYTLNHIISMFITLFFIFCLCKFPINKIYDLIIKELLLKLFFFIIIIFVMILTHRQVSYITFYHVFIMGIALFGLYHSVKKLFYYTNKYPALHHEMRNILAGIYVSAYSTDSIEYVRKNLSDYYDILGIEMNVDTMSKTDHNNNISNFISHKENESLKKIFTETDIRYYEDNLLVPITSIIYMLGILLDNAIDESKAGDSIKVYTQCAEYNLDIEVTNNYKENTDFKKMFQKGYSTKSEQRGYGLSNLKKVVDNYNGKIYIYRNCGEVTFGIEIRN